ncbi:MAG: arsenic efflux protein [Clostridiales bacterium]|nr:arsenic efflux protein [Clostridiales bacterium]
MTEIFLEALFDTLIVLPFLLVIYIVIELVEHKTSVFGNRKILQGKLAPLIGSAAGLVPLCGFSVMAAKLYDKKFIRTGTLLAVFIATSDEAIILLLSEVTNVKALSAVLPLLIIKFVLAVIVGYAANAILFREKVNETVAPLATDAPDYECGHEHPEESKWNIYLLTPLWHTLKIALYLFVINFVFGLIIDEQTIANSLAGNIYLQPLITAAVGLIPSCASSAILTSAYAGGIITFGSMAAGLVVNAGMGFMILLKNFKRIKQNLALIASTFALSYVVGILINVVAPFIPFIN